MSINQEYNPLSKIDFESTFEFKYQCYAEYPKYYTCANIDELVQKMRMNSLLNIDNIGEPFLEVYKNVTQRRYLNNPPPFNISELDLKNNLGHIWLYEAFTLDPNRQEDTNREEDRTHYFKFINKLEKIFIDQDEKININVLSNLQSCQNNLIPDVNNIIGNYSKIDTNYTRLVNSLIQLMLFLLQNHLLLRDYRCDRIFFSPVHFAFEPLTYLFYYTQKTGFNTYSLSCLITLQELLPNIITENSIVGSEKNCLIKFSRQVYQYQIATGKDDDNILDRNKIKLRNQLTLS
jgi:hypothetical protein